MTKVAMFVPVPIIGGVGVNMLQSVRLFDHSQFRVDFFVQEALPPEIEDRIIVDGGEVVVIPTLRHPIEYFRVTVKRLKGGNYDVAHACMSTLSCFPLAAALLAGVKIRIAHARSTSSFQEPLRHLAKLALRPFANLVANRYAACSEVAGKWQFGRRRFDRGEVKVCHTALELEKFRYSEMDRSVIRNEFGLGDGMVIGHIGRMCTVKNQLRLVEMFSALLKLRPEAKLLLVGGGDMRQMVEERVVDLGMRVGEQVVFAGERKDAHRFYNAMDVFVFPSLYEGLGRVLVEAQANGLGCVASDRVPREAKVLEGVCFLPLEANNGLWAAKIVERASAGRNSGDAIGDVARAGYDIAAAALEITALYA